MQTCTIMKNKQLMSLTIFDVDLLCLYGIHRTKRDTTCFSRDNDATITRRNGAHSDCFGIDVGDLMLPTGQWLPLQSLLAALETIKLGLVQI